MSGFLWLLFQILFLMLLSAVGGYFLRKWIERSTYKDVTVSYAKVLARQEAAKTQFDSLSTEYLSLQNNVESKLDGVLGHFSPLENKLKSLDMSAQLTDVGKKIGVIQTQISSLPKVRETDLSPVLGAISKIQIPEAKSPNLEPIMDAITSIRIPEAETVDLTPILKSIDNIRIPEQKEADLSPVLNAIESLHIPEQYKPDLTPVLDAIHSIRIPDKKELNTLPLMSAIRNIKIPQQQADLAPVLAAIRNIKIPQQQADLAPVLAAIRDIKIPQQQADLAPVLAAIRNIKIPQQQADLAPVLAAIRDIKIPQQQADLAPALAAIRNIKVPQQQADLAPVLAAIRNIKIPQQQADLAPVLTAIRNINIPSAKEPNLSPVLKEIEFLKTELKTRPAEQKVVTRLVKTVPSQENKDVVANRLGDKGNRLRKAAFGNPDDLKVISGVGPKLEKMLHGIGVYYYWQVADWSIADVQEADELLDVFKGRIERDNWVIQAGKLAKLSTASKRP